MYIYYNLYFFVVQSYSEAVSSTKKKKKKKKFRGVHFKIDAKQEAGFRVFAVSASSFAFGAQPWRNRLFYKELVMDLTPFKLDIDELIDEFVEGESTTLADMKRVWVSRKFSYIFEASPSNNLAFFMQSLYAHTMMRLIIGKAKSVIKVLGT